MFSKKELMEMFMSLDKQARKLHWTKKKELETIHDLQDKIYKLL